ncbi:MAG: glutamate--tRNA ligase [Thermoplasmata archaeon]
MFEEEIKKRAFQNAYDHKGKADLKSVVGKVLGDIPELRKTPKDAMDAIKVQVEYVNSLSFDQISEIVARDYPDLMNKEKKNEEHHLPDLEGVTGRVVMRLAPSPSGPLHIGHTRMSILNDEYVKRYGGDLILRLEDTNPANIDPDAYTMIPEDLKWLGVNVTKIVIQSDRFQIYYDEARKLIEMGKMYICRCDKEEFRKSKLASVPMPDRENDPEKNMELFDGMLDGKFEPGEAIAVVKTDLRHPNPSVRDWIAFRIINETHPRTGDRYHVYPMMSFSVAMDDHLLGLTHVLRGKDQLTNTEKQKYIFEYNNWKRPYYYHYGMIRIPGTILKTSAMKKGIKAGLYDSWSDIRLGTVRAMERRGYLPETFRRYWINSGLREIDAEFSWAIFNSINRELIDPSAYRFSFVSDPKKIEMLRSPGLKSYLPYHPSFKDFGIRQYDVKDEVFISRKDEDSIKNGERFRLKDLCYLIKNGDQYFYDGTDMREKTKIINWCPEGSRPFKIYRPDGNVDEGIIEPLSAGYRGVSQLERYGYVNFYDSDDYAYFLHD